VRRRIETNQSRPSYETAVRCRRTICGTSLRGVLLLVRRRDEAGLRQLAEAGNDDVVNRLVDLLAEREDEGPA
jgi:hypothetical protein